MRFLLFLPGFFFLVLSWLLAIREASRSSRKSGRQKSSAQKPPKATGTAAIKPIVIRDEPPQQPKRPRGRPRKKPPKAAAPQNSAPRREASSSQRCPDPVTPENHFSAPAAHLTFSGLSAPEGAATIGQPSADPKPEFRPSIGQLRIYEIIYSR